MTPAKRTRARPRRARKARALPAVDLPELTEIADEHSVPEARMTHTDRINGTQPNAAAIPGTMRTILPGGH